MGLTDNSANFRKSSYSTFSLDDVRKLFAIQILSQKFLQNRQPVIPSDWLKSCLSKASTIVLLSEKARSEFIVAPILLEVKELSHNLISVYSGVRLDVSPQEGLQGICDFVISKTPPLPTLQSPLIVMVEAKKNDIEEGLGQCAAEMIGAQRFNLAEGRAPAPVFGCVTTGELWQFLQLTDQELLIDPNKIYIEHIDQILAMLVAMIG